MKIQSINTAYNNSPVNFGMKFQIMKKQPVQFQEKCAEIPSNLDDYTKYTFLQKLDKEHEFFKSFLMKQGKLTLEEYKNIKENHPYVISRCYDICKQEGNLSPVSTPKSIANASRALKLHYDTLYGENNYKILSLGTSPATVTEAMKLLGCEVIFAPISNLTLPEENIKTEVQFPNIPILMDYCTQKGISKDKNKPIVLLDFAHTGITLATMTRILKERGDIPAENIKTHSLTEDLAYCQANYKNCWIANDDVYKLISDMFQSKTENMCNVPHFNAKGQEKTKVEPWTISSKNKSIQEIFKEFDNHSTPTGRAWALCVANELFKYSKIL